MKNSKYWSIIVLVALLFIVTICFNISHHNKIVELKESLQNKINSSEIINSFDGINLIENINNKSKYYTLDKQQIDRINTQLKSINSEISKQFQFASDLINNDIDRLNLYITVGIGFLGFIGIFIPIVTNIISLGDVKDKQEEIEKSQEDLDKKLGKIEKKQEKIDTDIISATSKSEIASKKADEVANLSVKIDAIEKRLTNDLPPSDTIILQNAIARFFNVSQIVFTRFNDPQYRDQQLNIMQHLLSGFEAYTNSPTSSINNDFFKATLIDFKLFILNRRYMTGAISKSVLINFDKIAVLLDNLEKTLDELKARETLSEVVQIIEKIINSLDIKDGESNS